VSKNRSMSGVVEVPMGVRRKTRVQLASMGGIGDGDSTEDATRGIGTRIALIVTAVAVIST